MRIFFFNSKAEAAENVTRTMKFGHLVSVNSYDLGTVRPNKLKCESSEKRVYSRVMQRDWWLRHTQKNTPVPELVLVNKC